MKKRPISIIAVIMAVIMIIPAYGCSLVSVNEDKDNAQVVAKVGDVEITKGEFMDELNYMIYMYQSFGMDVTSSPEQYETMKNDVLEAMISREVQYYKAIEGGFDKLSDETIAEINNEIATLDEEIYSVALSNAESMVAADSSLDLEKTIDEQYKSVSAQYIGEELSREDTKKFIEDYYTKDYVIQNLYDSIAATVSVTEEEVNERYNTMLEEDKTTYTDSPSTYKTDQEYFEMNGGIEPLYVPSGYKRFKEIAIYSSEEVSTEYTDKMTRMEELQNELGKLAMVDDPANAETIQAIRDEYAALKAETDKMSEDRLSAAQKKAQEAYDKLVAGASFDEVLKEYSEDTDYADYETIGNKGKLMHANTDTEDWAKELKDAALKLTVVGSYTDVIYTLEEGSEGYHILMYVGDESVTNRTFADNKEAIGAELLADKQSDTWDELSLEWSKDTSIVTRFADIIKAI